MKSLLKVAITGASGMLGTALLDCFVNQNQTTNSKYGMFEVFAASRTKGFTGDKIHWDTFDLSDINSLKHWLFSYRPDVVIHNAAIINVDLCEKEPHLSRTVHVDATKIMSDSISAWGGRLLYISTDAVFDGKKSGLYEETDSPNPMNVYAKTKWEGENITLEASNGLVLRTTIFGWNQSNRISFAEWVLKGLVEQSQLTMFSDVFFTPIHVSHAANIIAKIIVSDMSGIYHLSGSSVLSKYEFAKNMSKTFNLCGDNIISTSVEKSNLIAFRSKNMTLTNAKLIKDLNIQIPTVDEGIELFKKQYESGWLSKVKGKELRSGYQFWV